MRGQTSQKNAAHATFHVSTEGRDAWSGKLASPKAGGSDGPFATLTRARDAVRELKASGKLREPATVMVRGGKYFLDRPLVLAAEDSGSHECPMTYTAYPGETPVLSGGRAVTGWEPYKGRIVQCELPWAKGGKWRSRQLFFNGARMRRARWPKFEPANPLYGGWALMEGPAFEGATSAFSYKPGAFRHRWAKPTEGEVSFYGSVGWVMSTVPIRAVHDDARVIELTHSGWQFDVAPWHIPCPFQPDNRFYVENLLEELDQPGQWCFDSEEARLYFWPPEGPRGKGEAVVPVLECLIDMVGAAHVVISGFTLTETTDGDNFHRDGMEGCGAMYPRPGWRYCGEAVRLKGCKGCTIERNVFQAVGGNAVYLEGRNHRNVVRHNEIAGAGACGVCLAGTRVRNPFANEVCDNHIHHCGVFNKYAAGIFSAMGNGNVLSHNLIEHLPHHAINLSNSPHGRNIVEYNAIRHVCEEVADNGAINCWMEEPAEWQAERCGHVIRFNVVADVMGCGVLDGKVAASNAFPTSGIYLDNYTSNCFVYGNLLIRCTTTGIMVHGGKNNVIEGNVIVDCGENIRFQDYVSGLEYWNGMRGFMSGNHVLRNIFWQTGPGAVVLCLHAFTDRSMARCDENVIFQAAGSYALRHDTQAPEEERITTLTRWRSLGYDAHSVVADPLFVDPEHDDYRLRPQSPALKLGFVPLDVRHVGPRRDRAVR
jgi:parallel beta-helix repeat protein